MDDQKSMYSCMLLAKCYILLYSRNSIIIQTVKLIQDEISKLLIKD